MKHVTVQPLTRPVSAEVSIPGSKSYTNRALLLAAMTPGQVTLLNHLLSDDTAAMMDCLRVLGITIETYEDRLVVNGGIDQIDDKDYILHARISGTTLRFLLPFCCLIPGIKTLGGAEGLNKRPIAPLVEALRELGAEITYLEKEGFPPVKIASSTFKKKNVTMKGDISSQYFSALMMAAPLADGLTITVSGQQISQPYIDMTISSMKAFGVIASNNSYTSYDIAANQSYSSNSYVIEGDYSSAGYFFAIAALTQSTVTLHNLKSDSVQADKKLLDALALMGTEISAQDNSVSIKGHGVKALTLDVISFPDQAQTLAVLAAFAQGTTVLQGVQSLRVKETERVVAIQQELAKMDIKTEATHDTLVIHGGEPKPAAIDTYGDHRMAMSFAVAGSVLAGMTINDAAVVGKTFPTFWEKLQQIGIVVEIHE
jgi:3-phosphoshikimate 1-carboxyvinyltransferase